jgi:hypothetical protein
MNYRYLTTSWGDYIVGSFVVRHSKSGGLTSLSGHSRPMHSVPVPINVRCYSNSDIIVRRSEVTLRAISGLMHCNMICGLNGICD